MNLNIMIMNLLYTLASILSLKGQWMNVGRGEWTFWKFIMKGKYAQLNVQRICSSVWSRIGLIRPFITHQCWLSCWVWSLGAHHVFCIVCDSSEWNLEWISVLQWKYAICQVSTQSLKMTLYPFNWEEINTWTNKFSYFF